MTKLITLYQTKFTTKLTTDTLVMPATIQQNHQRLASLPLRKRRRNYAEKIQNDPLVFSI